MNTNTSVRPRSQSPKLPVARRHRPFLVTSGPEPMSWKDFDRKILNCGAKYALVTFLVTQDVHGLFRRPIADPIHLGKVILKHARKRLVRRPLAGAAAIKAAGHDILSFYAKPQEAATMCARFNSVVNKLSL